MKRRSLIIGPHELEKLPIVCQIEIEAPTVSTPYFLETNRKWRHREPWLKTSVHNPAHGAIEPLIFPTTRRLCSSLAIAAFGQESFASNPCDCGIFAPAARRYSAPASSGKPSVKPMHNLLPHENEPLKKCLRLSRKTFRRSTGMNRKAKPARRCLRANKSACQNREMNCLHIISRIFGSLYFSLRFFISSGYKSSVETLKTEASRKSSVSFTQRSRASMCDRVPRLISKPANWQRVASCSWVRRSLFRNFLICGPTTLAGVLVRAMLSLELDPILKRRFHC
jgi:hypothetical protein